MASIRVKMAGVVLLLLAAGSAAGQQPRTDCYGDPLPAGALVRFGTVRFRHGYDIGNIAFFPDGKRVASFGSDGTVRIWDVATDKEMRRLLRPGPGGGPLDLSPDGKLLAWTTGSDEYAIRVLDLTTGKELWRTRPNEDFTNAVAVFAPNCKLMASIIWGRGDIRLWEATTGKEMRRWSKRGHEVWRIAFSPDSRKLASVGREGEVLLWDVATGKEIRLLVGKGKSSRVIAFSPDGKALAISNPEGMIDLWDPATGKQTKQLRGDGRPDEGDLVDLAFSPGGQLLASAELYRGVAVWDVAAGKQVRRLHEGQWADYHVAFSADGKLLASGGEDGVVRLWDVASGQETHKSPGHQGGLISAGFLPDGKSLVTRGWKSTRLWDTATGKERRALPAGLLSPDRQTLASQDKNSTVYLWDVTTGRERASLKGHKGAPTYIRFSPDGKVVATLDNAAVRLWDGNTGKQLHRLRLPWGSFSHFSFSLDGKTLHSHSTSMGLGNRHDKWDVASGRAGKEDPPLAVYGFLADSPGHEVIAGVRPSQGRGAPDTVLVWRHMVPIHHPLGRLMHSVTPIDAGYVTVIIPGEKTPASVAPQLNFARWLYTASLGRHPRPLQKHRDDIYLALFSPDGRTLATVGEAPVIRLWEVASSQERCRFVGHQGWVMFLDFSPDGKRLASASWDTTALIWDVTGQQADAKPKASLTTKELESLWSDLGGTDAARAYRAVWTLAAAPKESVPFLRHRLKQKADPARLSKLIAGLDSDDYQTRDRASAELKQLADLAEPALRKALEGKPTAEVKARINRLLAHLDGPGASGEWLRALRARRWSIAALPRPWRR